MVVPGGWVLLVRLPRHPGFDAFPVLPFLLNRYMTGIALETRDFVLLVNLMNLA